tara:strand:+ start:2762 stop:3403 length:642 start_codon:yes stop_codon:yes gene_type:complete
MISFNNICKIYSKNKIFYNANFSIKKGDFVFLTGESGSGKTTFMRLLSGLEKPDKGSIIVNDADITKFNKKELSDYRRKIGIIMQNNIFIENETVSYNISLPLLLEGESQVSEKIEAILDMVNLDKKIYNSIKSLAAGERQRVAIARAIIDSPDIILADEPTNNLDQKLSEAVMKMLIQLNKYGTTVIVTTHELSLAKKLKQNILSINNAEII